MSSTRGKALTVEKAVQLVSTDDDSDFNEEDEEELKLRSQQKKK